MTALRIGCWNIKTGARTTAIRDRLAALRLDIALLQEVDLWTPRVQGQHVARTLFPAGMAAPAPWVWAFGPSLQSQSAGADDAPALYGNLVAVRGEIRECLTVDLGPTGADPAFHDRAPHLERRSAVIARVRCRGRSLVVATAHLRHGDGQDAVRRLQTRQLLALLERFALPADTVVLAADFNATVAEIDGWGMPPAWRRHSPAWPAAPAPVSMRLGVDHVLLRGGSALQVTAEATDGLSDHHPLLALLD